MSAAGFAVYVVTNTTNGKQYVGITSRLPARRWWEHRNSARKGSAQPLHAGLRKYGEGAFAFAVVATLDTWDAACARERAEIAARGTVKPAGYNLTTGGEGLAGYTTSDVTRAKVRAGHRAWLDSPAGIAFRERSRVAMREKATAMHADPEHQRAHAARLVAVWSDPARRAAESARQIAACASPEVRAAKRRAAQASAVVKRAQAAERRAAS